MFTDWGAFLFGGVPSGGTDTGASEIKSMEQRKLFGGFANTAADACYHQSCDTILNVAGMDMCVHYCVEVY